MQLKNVLQTSGRCGQFRHTRQRLIIIEVPQQVFPARISTIVPSVEFINTDTWQHQVFAEITVIFEVPVIEKVQLSVRSSYTSFTAYLSIFCGK